MVSTMPMTKLLLALSAVVCLTRALDVEVTDYECDSSLYVTADFNVKCDGKSRCTFGQSTATVAGKRTFR